MDKSGNRLLVLTMPNLSTFCSKIEQGGLHVYLKHVLKRLFVALGLCLFMSVIWTAVQTRCALF